MPDTELPKEHHCRPSHCAGESLQAEVARVRQMTVEERIRAALALKSKFASLQPTPLNRQHVEKFQQVRNPPRDS